MLHSALVTVSLIMLCHNAECRVLFVITTSEWSQNWRHDIQHNDIQHNDIRHNDTQHKGLICDTQYKGLICDTQH